jgi:soluble lytic murein transglycosylase-like protein
MRRAPSLRSGLAALVASLGLMVSAAHADVWGYVDDKGVAHFAAEKVDERYELFFRGGQSYDTSEGVAPVELPRPVAVPTAPSKLLAFFDVSPGYKAVKHLLRDAAADHQLDYELLQALIATESGFDADAVSPRGAIGLMQVMPTTAQRYGISGDPKTPIEKKLADPRTNIRAGSRYLRDLLRMFPGQLELALAAYNAGEGAVQRAGNRVPNYRETQNYVRTVMQLYEMLKPPAPVVEQRRAPAPARVRVEIPGTATGAVPGGAIGRGNMITPLRPAP